MPTVTKREAARRDRVEHVVYRAENTGLEVAERFLNNAEISFQDPACGTPASTSGLTVRSAISP
jgi:toxin ParE1/3/4